MKKFKLKEKHKDMCRKINNSNFTIVVYFVLLFIFLICVAKCTTSSNNVHATEPSEIPFEVVSGPQKIYSNRYIILRDKETGVEYILVYDNNGHGEIAITPRLKGENNE